MEIELSDQSGTLVSLAVVLDGLAEPAVAIDAEGMVLGANIGARALLRRRDDEMVGRPFRLAIGHRLDEPPQGPPMPDCMICEAVGRPRQGALPGTVITSDREEIPVDATVGGITSDQPVRLVLLHDERPRRKREEALVDRASRDPVTGLTMRQGLLHHASTSRGQPGRGVALLLIDLDGFKDVNDHYGHGAGDLLLAALAGRLRSLVRNGDLIVRYGGDEFAVLAVDCDPATARSVARRIVQSLERPISVQGLRIPIGASIGVGLSHDTNRLPQLLHDADNALRDAKHNGKGCVVIAGEPVQEPAVQLREVDVDAARAWARYIRRLREEIAAAKEAGVLPWHLAAPEPIHRTLLRLLTAIDRLPDAPTANLALPHPQRLLPFAIYVPAVLRWADRLTARGVLTTQRPAEADGFWQQLEAYADGDEWRSVDPISPAD